VKQARPEEPSAAIEAAVRSGLRDTRWPGRLEVIDREPLTVIDVGHTPDGIGQSLASLKATHGTEGWILVVGVSFDKKASEIVGALAPSFDTIICTAAHHKGSDAAAIAAIARKINPQAKVHIAATIEEAFRTSRTLAASLGRKIYVAGGLFTAIEFAAVGRGMRATDLDFF
jgi:dihydrofolate synthase/folylpolyglutamate synthase